MNNEQVLMRPEAPLSESIARISFDGLPAQSCGTERFGSGRPPKFLILLKNGRYQVCCYQNGEYLPDFFPGFCRIWQFYDSPLAFAPKSKG